MGLGWLLSARFDYGWARLSAAHALGMFGTDAKSAVPSLMVLTNAATMFNGGILSVRVQVVLEALNALKKIYLPVVAPPIETFPVYGVPAADSPIPPR